MKTSLLLSSASLALTASAHYVFPALIQDGSATGEWQYVRDWTGSYTNGPVTDVSSLDIRCNVDGSKAGNVTETLPVTAGSKIGFSVRSSIGHPGPLLAYLAKAPSSASSFDGAGEVWFKIYEDGPEISADGLTWPSDGLTSVEFTIPAAVPDGEYLLRVEHIALHSAGTEGGAQFYISCGQISVSGGGSGSPGPLVALPGAYDATDPGLLINIYYPVPTEYTPPGPAVWSG
ncbi:glycoside hydrolase [Aspergillus pseudoustus]|uniref:lytic cellulose monooxygenase (C4-dehydrogenating) n=1 Tax=Aspergillus pseudoustus TaxID=1810923 RepID=A0ABR4KWA5_9EURO